MRKKRFRRVLTGVVCALLILITLALAAVVALIGAALLQSDGQRSLSLFEYSLYRNDSSFATDDLPAGAVVLVRRVPHETLQSGDRIVCRDLSVSGQFYPVIRIVYTPCEPDSSYLMAESVRDAEILPVNRDDILGKCVGASVLLGGLLELLQGEQRVERIAILLGAFCFLFGLCLLWYLFLGKRRPRTVPPVGEPPELSALIEEETEVELSIGAAQPPSDPSPKV